MAENITGFLSQKSVLVFPLHYSKYTAVIQNETVSGTYFS
jgi:hypothetical protein